MHRLALAAFLAAAPHCRAADPAPAKASAPKTASKGGLEPKTDEQRVLYAWGMAIARSISQFDLSPEEFKYVLQGARDYGVAKKVDQSVDWSLYGNKIHDLQQSRNASKTEREKKKSLEYLEKAAKQKGAQKFPSGLVYTEVKAGPGASPAETDTVKVHYQGALINGTIFDSSWKRNAPAEFPLNGVIRCWTEGVQKMKIGGKAILVCPSDIAYGDQGRPPSIPGGATLVFDVELLEIKGK